MVFTDHEILDIFHELTSLQDLPVGFYLVRPDGRFLIASRTLRCLLRCEDDDAILQMRSVDFYANHAEREEVIRKAIQEAGQGWHLEREPIHLRVDGEDLYAEDFCKPLFSPGTQEVIGFYGCLIDRTEEYLTKKNEDSLRERVSELTLDIGQVLHSNSSTLLMVKQTLDPVLKLLTYEQALNPEDVTRLMDQEGYFLDQYSKTLVRAIQRLTENVKPELRDKVLRPLRWDYLQQLTADLSNYHSQVDLHEAVAPYLRHITDDVLEVINEIKPGLIPRELVRDVRSAAQDIQRAILILSVIQTNQLVLQMDHSIKALREFITQGVRADEGLVYKPVHELLETAIAGLTEFANSCGVEMVVKNTCPTAGILCRERDMARAFANVLHNAIKYSWSRGATRHPWVTIEVRAVHNELHISFEDWGVAIPRDEIERGDIFQLGYRGRLSRDRQRQGTGIGLTDARRIARLHNGGIHVQSRPAAHTLTEDQPNYYTQPFITTVEFILPLAKKE